MPSRQLWPAAMPEALPGAMSEIVPEASVRISQLLNTLHRAVERDDLPAAERISRTLHDQVISLEVKDARRVLAVITGIREIAQHRRQDLSSRLRQRRGARQAVSAYQQAAQ